MSQTGGNASANDTKSVPFCLCLTWRLPTPVPFPTHSQVCHVIAEALHFFQVRRKWVQVWWRWPEKKVRVSMCGFPSFPFFPIFSHGLVLRYSLSLYLYTFTSYLSINTSVALSNWSLFFHNITNYKYPVIYQIRLCIEINVLSNLSFFFIYKWRTVYNFKSFSATLYFPLFLAKVTKISYHYYFFLGSCEIFVLFIASLKIWKQLTLHNVYL